MATFLLLAVFVALCLPVSCLCSLLSPSCADAPVSVIGCTGVKSCSNVNELSVDYCGHECGKWCYCEKIETEVCPCWLDSSIA